MRLQVCSTGAWLGIGGRWWPDAPALLDLSPEDDDDEEEGEDEDEDEEGGGGEEDEGGAGDEGGGEVEIGAPGSFALAGLLATTSSRT